MENLLYEFPHASRKEPRKYITTKGNIHGAKITTSEEIEHASHIMIEIAPTKYNAGEKKK